MFLATGCSAPLVRDIPMLSPEDGDAMVCRYADDFVCAFRFREDAESFYRVSDAIEILRGSGESFEFEPAWGADLQTEHERYLTERHFKKPVIVHDYPKDIKAFYMRLHDDGRTVAAMDVLVPRIGEIIGGSQREERFDVLRSRINEMGFDEGPYWWYLDSRRFGSVPHSGFGLGFERFLMLVTGVTNIRDVIPFPRTPKHLEF